MDFNTGPSLSLNKNQSIQYDDGDIQFDDWYMDGEGCDERLTNQAAILGEAKEEERKEIKDERFQEVDVCLGAQLMLRFTVGDEKKKFIRYASCHLAKKVEDNKYIALTARTNWHFNKDGQRYDADSAYVFLQKTDGQNGQKVFLARFKVDACKHF